MYNSIYEVTARVLEHRDEVVKLGHDYFFVALQGSWNYMLDYEKSDVDTKALILPNFKQIVLNKKVISTTHIMENNEHLDLKDVRVMFENFWKQNINFLEILFTNYVTVNPSYLEEYFELTRMAEDIAHYDEAKALNCMCGMAMEKYHALKHPYPAVAADIEKYGYSPKEFHHILRMYNFLLNYIHGMSFKECLIYHSPYSREQLMKAKLGEYSLDFAENVSAELVSDMKELKDEYLENNNPSVNTKTRSAAEDVLYHVLENKFRFDLNI